MTGDLSNIFQTLGQTPRVNTPRAQWAQLKLPRNPFNDGAYDSYRSRPFYTAHLREVLSDLARWLQEVEARETTDSFALRGAVGVGKTHLLAFMEEQLRQPSPDKRIVLKVELTQKGYRSTALGGLILEGLSQRPMPWMPKAPDGVLSLLWTLAEHDKPVQGEGQLAGTLRALQQGSLIEREDQARLYTRWLFREDLTPRELKQLGMHGRLDWEGELIWVLAEILRLGYAVDAWGVCFLLLDQFEDLFRDTYSDLKRARILTDLRTLHDEAAERKAPLGLLISYSPDMEERLRDDGQEREGEVEAQLGHSYAALKSRMDRRKQSIRPLQGKEEATAFARAWIQGLEQETGVEAAISDERLREIVDRAIQQMQQGRTLLTRHIFTPRQLLAALKAVMEEPG